MPAKNLLRVDQEGTYSHIYNKGVESRIIFNDSEDYDVFLGYLKEYLSPATNIEAKKKEFTVKGKTFLGTPHQPKNYHKKVEVIAYNLMPTHFHLVLHQAAQGALENFLRSLSTRYSMYFNKKYKRQGALFEGPYKSVQIPDLTLLLHFVAYLENTHKNNKYSSQAEYRDPQANLWINSSILLNLFKDFEVGKAIPQKSYADFVSKYSFDQTEKILLTRLMLEKHEEVLVPPSIQEAASPKPAAKPATTSIPEVTQTRKVNQHSSLRIPEYAGLSFLFIVLLGFSMRNIGISSLEAKAPTTVLTASSNIDTPDYASLDVKNFSEGNSNQEVLSSTDSAIDLPTPTAEPDDLVYSPILIATGSGVVNVYTYPLNTSEVHRTAKDGDQFEGTPYDENWFEIKLNETIKGFLESKYVGLEQKASQ